MKNPFPDTITPHSVILERSATYHKGKHDGWEAGVADMVAWIKAPCDNPKHSRDLFGDGDKTKTIFWHRFQCPLCMEGLNA